MKIVGISTGTLQLKPTFLDGSPAHGGSLGLIRTIRRDSGWTQPLPMWSFYESDCQQQTPSLLIVSTRSP